MAEFVVKVTVDADKLREALEIVKAENPNLVTVIPCKDCFYCEMNKEVDETSEIGWCVYHDSVVDSMDFCSKAKERRE